MFKLKPIAAVLGACLLQACVAPPARQEMAMQPVLQVRHSSDQLAATYYQLGKYHHERGNLDLALAAYTRSIELDRRQLEARNALASIHSQQGRLEEAKSILLQLVADYPGVAHPYNNLGYVYTMLGNVDAAETTLQQALMLDPGNERARNNLAVVQAALASRGERTVAAVGLAPTVSETKAAFPDTTTVNRKDGEAVTAHIPSPSAMPSASRLVEPTASSAAAPQPQRLAITNVPVAPQTRMELVQIVPNVFELKLKAAIAPAVAERQGTKTVAAAAAPIPALAPATRISRVEVANGNGVSGMAQRIRGVLGQHGIAVSRLTNELPYKQQNTKIQYRVGYEQEAAALKGALGGFAVMVPINVLSGNADVRLVLGKDAIGQLASIEGTISGSRLVLNETPN
jgi:Tfp pilus assembly protein PilF